MTMLAPLAAADDPPKEPEPERPDDAAWVEDCPPDMMCAASANESEPSADEPTYSGDCGGEVCAYDGEQPRDCIDCTKAPDEPVSSDEGSNCMGGQQENETCRDDVRYLDGGSRGPADGSCENCRGGTEENPEVAPVSAPSDGADAGITSDAKEASQKSVPAPAVALGLLAVAGVAVLLAGRGRD